MEDMTQSDMKKITDARRAANEEKYLNQSKASLTRHLEKKFKTTMIGALSVFEDKFGFLWGHGKSEDELSEEELRYRELWQLTRTEVLNNGNNQLRAAKEEMSFYTVRFNKFETKFKFKDRKDISND